MTIARTLEALSPVIQEGSCLTIGNFDGVHLGHQALLEVVRKKAGETGLPSIAVTFEPHPLQVLKGWTPRFITNPEQKLELLSQAGIEHILCLKFDKQMAGLKPHKFVQTYLVQGLRIKELIIGHDYAFGKRRSGDFHLLQELGQKHGFRVQRIGPVYYKGQIVSSTRIRKLIEQGLVHQARPLLNRFFQIQGVVIQGARRGGKVLGVPTANLNPGNELCPKPGVYALWTEFKGQYLPSVANVGHNPTFGDNTLSVEVHILDFCRDIYGCNLNLLFVQRIRDEVKFSGVDALLEQIHKDIARAREILALQENQPQAGTGAIDQRLK